MIIVDTDYLCWLVKKSIKARKNMCSVKVVTSSLAESMVVLMPGGVGVNSCAFPKDRIDDVIQALQAYKAALPKPCVHAELIKQYAEDCQKYEKPWELWECIFAWNLNPSGRWYKCTSHPNWDAKVTYRRKLGAPL